MYQRLQWVFESVIRFVHFARKGLVDVGWLGAARQKQGAADAANPIVCETHTYAVKDLEKLSLDWYKPAVSCTDRLVLFVHGGGFSEGSRNDPRYTQFAESLARAGISVACMSYRLPMRGKSFACDQLASEKVRAFRSASEDIWDATQYLLQQRSQAGGIVLCGSSAGAEAVLHAAYWPAPALPMGFRYDGVIGMAAAILHLEWITSDTALPTLLFHGVDDPLVPYGSASHHYCKEGAPGYLMLHGSGSIARHFEQLAQPCTLITGQTGGHGWADKPLFHYQREICRFVLDLG
ncbi:MAG: alpha/beta hydrolase [Haliscomenobacter sp.]